MGCVLGKPSMNSPLRGLQKLKLENGYAGKGGNMGARRSTGHRNIDRPFRGGTRNNNANGGYGYGSQKVRREGEIDGGGGGGNVSQRKQDRGDEIVDGWPKWLTDNIPREALAGLVPRSAESYDKLDKVGQGTYSNVYKARDRATGKIVALKKVRFDTSEPESVKFMAREIMILQRLDHPNIVKLEGLATSRMQYSLYLVFDFMPSDLARVISRPDGGLTEPQIKCYMHQLLSGLQHCHERGILHRDIKGSNLLIDKNGMLKIGDFGLANYFNPHGKRHLTSRVVTLWYRAPELLLGATNYGVGIDLWSAGCLLAEMFAGRPIMPGRTEVEQLHRIFKLCGTPSEDYWKKMKLSTTFRPPHTYKRSLFEAFREFPESSLGLLSNLLALDPGYRGSASSALQDEFFHTIPLACDLSGLPVINKEDDESSQANEQRKYRNSKMKQRARTHRERRKKDVVIEVVQEDFGSLKEEVEKSAEPNVHNQEPGSSRSSGGSTSSGVKPTRRELSPPFLLSPVASPHQKMSPRTQGHPNASQNIKNMPPLPTSKTRNTNYNKENGNRFNQVHRSASTREFRKVDQRKHLKLYAVDD
ncbi:hypothetical protein L1049_025887 [Liquidambar formosana]|uniref:Protein kinase domain-containing protein n=1 Tax=Liquidambar formosana TaxID=63359 RepID=A0AAP0NFD1_LIQFO